MPAMDVAEIDKIEKLSPSSDYEFGINLDFIQGPNSSFSNLVLLANNYLNSQNPPVRISLDENEPGETSESSMDRDSPVKPKIDLIHPCTICQIEAATVSHFNVDVCTGCRAFFRRSVSVN